MQVFTNGGEPLPALNSAPRPADLVETPVFVRGGGDGSFDDGDAVFFYADGPSGWDYVVERNGSGAIIDQRWTHYVHPYDTTNYVFIKVAGTESAQVGVGEAPGTAGGTVREQVQGRFFEDFDEYMWSREAGTGLTWVSNRIFDGGSRTLLENEALPGLASGSAEFVLRSAAGSTQQSQLRFDLNSGTLGTVLISGRPNTSISTIARPKTATFTQQVSGGAGLTLRLTLAEQGADGE
ncbi:MAG: hypothetical protein GVY18_11640, partial [Bacteroidetes bacterium]|nr:hypothetical protein [Bacteroidota bacterium]